MATRARSVTEEPGTLAGKLIGLTATTLSIDERWLVRQRFGDPAVTTPLDDELTTHERSRVESALAASKGRVSGPTGAAARLGVPRSTLESKIRSLKVDKHRFRGNEQ